MYGSLLHSIFLCLYRICSCPSTGLKRILSKRTSVNVAEKQNFFPSCPFHRLPKSLLIHVSGYSTAMVTCLPPCRYSLMYILSYLCSTRDEYFCLFLQKSFYGHMANERLDMGMEEALIYPLSVSDLIYLVLV